MYDMYRFAHLPCLKENSNESKEADEAKESARLV